MAKTKAQESSGGAWVRAARLRAGLSQNKVARALEISPQAYQAWEAERSRPSPEHLAQFCALVGADLVEGLRALFYAALAEQAARGRVTPGFLNAPLALTPRRGRAA